MKTKLLILASCLFGVLYTLGTFSPKLLHFHTIKSPFIKKTFIYEQVDDGINPSTFLKRYSKKQVYSVLPLKCTLFFLLQDDEPLYPYKINPQYHNNSSIYLIDFWGNTKIMTISKNGRVSYNNTTVGYLNYEKGSFYDEKCSPEPKFHHIEKYGEYFSKDKFEKIQH